MITSAVAALAALLASAGCGAGDDGGASPMTSGSSPVSSVPDIATTAPPASVATTNPPEVTSTSGPATSGGSELGPTTTAPPSSVPTDATLPVAAPEQGWVTADLPGWATIPCCASEWPVEASSPQLPAPSDPLPDGVFRFEVVPWGWMTDDPGRIRIRVSRFEVCGPQPTVDIWCESGDPEEIGESYAEAIEFSLALDADVTVGFTGAACMPDGTGPARQGWVGDGRALQELWLEVDAVFEREVRPLFRTIAGWPLVMHELATGSSFTGNLCSPSAGDEVYHVAYESTGGPTLLYQGPGASHWASSGFEGWQLLRPVTIEVRRGRMLLMFEQCYQS